MANKNTYTPYEEVNPNAPRRSSKPTLLARPGFWITVFCVIAAIITLNASCTVIDSGEIGIKFHKWSANEQDYGGVEGTCKGWVFYNPITTSVFSYPTYIQRKNYEAFNVNAKDASVFSMDPTIAYRINPEKACDIFTKYRKGIEDLENGYIRTCGRSSIPYKWFQEHGILIPYNYVKPVDYLQIVDQRFFKENAND